MNRLAWIVILLLLLAMPAAGRSPARPETKGKAAAEVTERDLDPAGCAASMMNFLEKKVAARFPRFKNRVDMSGGKYESGRYTLTGALFADNGRPMQLLSEFVEAVEGTRLVRAVVPRHAKRGEENPNRLAFTLQIDADPGDIPWDPVREQTFAVKVPQGDSPVRVKVELADSGKRSTLLDEARAPGEMVQLRFRTTGPAKLRVSYDGVPFKTFDLE